MNSRLIRNTFLALGWAVFSLAVVWPTLALLGRCVVDGVAPADGFVISARQWILLAKSTGLAAFGALAAVVVSIPAAFVLGRLGIGAGRGRGPVLSTLMVAALLFPPMVYAFGWQKLLPPAFPEEVQCIGVWALWAYPIPALLIGAGWSRLGRAAYRAALLDMTPFAAFARVALPMLAPYVTTAAVILFVIFLGEYSVPHACSLKVYSTELLGWSDQSRWPIDTLWPSTPPIALIMFAVLAARWAWRKRAEDREWVAGDGVRGSAGVLVLAAVVCFAVSPVLPLAVLGVKLKSLGVMEEALRTYGVELLQSLAVAGLGGLLIAMMGICVVAWRPARRTAAVWALALGAMPGALVGEAVVAAYQPIGIIYEHWPLVVLGYAARFGWVGVLTMWLVSRAREDELAAQARTDGADEISVALRIHAAAAWPTLLFGGCLAAAMSLAELPTSSLVRVPSIGLIAHILVEKFHRFEDGMLISISLWLVISAIPAAALLAIALRRQRIYPTDRRGAKGVEGKGDRSIEK